MKRVGRRWGRWNAPCRYVASVETTDGIDAEQVDAAQRDALRVDVQHVGTARRTAMRRSRRRRHLALGQLEAQRVQVEVERARTGSCAAERRRTSPEVGTSMKLGVEPGMHLGQRLAQREVIDA